MHRAGPLGPGRHHGDVRLKRHAALGTCAGPRLADLGIHGTHVHRSRWSGCGFAMLSRIHGGDFRRLTLRNVLLRISFEFLAAASTAEVIGLALVRRSGRGFSRIDAHPANRVLLQLAADLHRGAADLNHGGHPSGLVVRRKIFLRIIFEFLRAAARAEVIQLALVLHRSSGL